MNRKSEIHNSFLHFANNSAWWYICSSFSSLMSFKLWTTTVAIVLALFAVGPRAPAVCAQTVEAMCASNFTWNKNSLGQDPCTVASDLLTPCLSLDSSETLPPLNSNSSYAPPNSTAELMCGCNTVVYSLFEACASCQGAAVISWPFWSAGCKGVAIAQLPFKVPPGTAVPHWAFLNVTALPNQTYNDSTAMSAGRDPETGPQK